MTDVVHVITTLTTGGAERQLELLIRGSSTRSATIALYEGGAVADAMQARGDRVEILQMTGWRKWASHLRLARKLRRLHPDVVHVHLLSGQLWGIPAARLARVPVIVSSEHSLMDDSIEGRPLTFGLHLLYRALTAMATHTLAVSDVTAARLARWGVRRDRITLMENGIDFKALAFDPAARARTRAELGLDEDVVAVVAVGRLDPVKRMDQVLLAMADRLRSGGHVLLIAGAGDLRSDLEALACELGVGPAVRWLGASDDVPALLSAADALVSASRDETFGLAVVEAIAAGLPVAYVQCPALEAMNPPVDAALRVDRLAVDQVQALSAALDRILLAPQRFAVDPRLIDRYDAAATATRIDELYDDLLGRAHRSRCGR